MESYNKYMGGVDLLDRFLSEYRPQLHSKKWWWCLFANFLNMSVVAAWRLHKEIGGTSVFFKVWLEEPLSNFERPLIFFLMFLSVLSFVYTIVEADFERPLDNFEKPFRFLKSP